MKNSGLDQGLARPDAHAKAGGKALYVDDLKFPGMLHGFIVGAPVASGEIQKLDLSEVKSSEGVEAVVTSENLNGNNSIALIFDDQPLLISNRIKMAGDRIALIAAQTREQAVRAARKVKIDVKELPGVYDVRDSLKPESPLVHENGNLIKEFYVKRGNFSDSVENSEVILEEEYDIGGQEHAYLETQGTFAVPQPDGSWVIYVSTQCPFYVRARVAKFLGIGQNMVRVVQTVTGGAFGGKEDYPDEPAMCAVALAKATNRPVKLVYDRTYDMQVSTKRHSMVIKHKLYADKDGKINGVKVNILVDAGAYAGLSTVVAERANISSVGPYSIENIEVLTQVIYTNNLFGGPYRGFGAPQVSTAHEATIDKLARVVNKDPFEIRELNGVSKEKPAFASGEILAQAHLYGEVLKRLKAKSSWDEHKAKSGAVPGTNYAYGIGTGTMIYGVNLHWGGMRLDRGGAYLIVQNDSTVSLSVGITEMGQGALASMRTICAAALGVKEQTIRVAEVDTATVPDSGPTVASRATHSGGNAVVDACRKINEKLHPLAEQLLGSKNIKCEMGVYSTPDTEKTVTFKEVVELLYTKKINPAVIGWFASPDRIYDPETGQGNAYAFYTFGGHVARVKVNLETGKVTVLEMTAVHDVGKIIHKMCIEGQVHGGVVQGLGWALMEQFKLKKGVMLNAGFTDYLIPTSLDAPPVINMDFIEEPEPQGPYGAKGIGEPSFISVGPSIINAVADAIGKDVKVLPLTPENVYNIISDDK
jgi:CO/xanthine dehydrogenase Mo-binding subunit